MPLSGTLKGWVEAARILGIDPSITVPCPACRAAALVVEDSFFPDGALCERIMACPACKAWNILVASSNMG